MSNTTSDSVSSHAQRIAELVTAICNSMLETSLILPKLVQAIDSLDTLLKTISKFEISTKTYELQLDVQGELAYRSFIRLYVSTRSDFQGIRISISIRGNHEFSSTEWQKLKERVSTAPVNADDTVRILITAQTIASNIDKIIEWLKSILEDVNQRNTVLLGYIDTMHLVISDPEISKLLILKATAPQG